MTVEELEVMWNAQADLDNQWCELGLDEIVDFAQRVEREACASVSPNDANVCAGDSPHQVWEKYRLAIRMRSNAKE